MESRKEKEKTPTVSLCELCQLEEHQPGENEATASHECEDCSYKLCQLCAKGHQTFTKGHNVKVLESPQAESTVQQTDTNIPQCTSHPENKIQEFCMPCEVLLCQSCKADHQKHETEPMPDDVKNKTLYEVIARFSPHIGSMYAYLNKLESKLSKGNEAQSLVVSRKQNIITAVSNRIEEDASALKLKMEDVENAKQSLELQLDKYIDFLMDISNLEENATTLHEIVTLSQKVNQIVKRQEDQDSFAFSDFQVGGHENTDMLLKNCACPILYWKKPQLKSQFNITAENNEMTGNAVKIAINPRNAIVVTDCKNNKVKTFSNTGQLLHSNAVARRRNGSGIAFNQPWGLAFIEDRQVVTHALGDVMFFSDRFKLNHYKHISCCRDIAPDSQGNFYITTTEKGCLYVMKHGEERTFSITQNGKAITLNNPLYITCTPEDDLVITDTGHSSLYIINKEGELAHIYGRYGHGPNEFNEVRGVCIDPHGNIVVADRGHNRLHLLTAKAEFICHLLDGEVNKPQSVLFDKEGNLLVSEIDTGLIKTFSYDVKPL